MPYVPHTDSRGPGLSLKPYPPLVELPSLWLQSVSCSVFSVRVPSLSQEVPLPLSRRVFIAQDSQLGPVGYGLLADLSLTGDIFHDSWWK